MPQCSQFAIQKKPSALLLGIVSCSSADSRRIVTTPSFPDRTNTVA
jgi:hypothetical protein